MVAKSSWTAAKLLRASESLSSLADSESDHHKHLQKHSPIELAAEPNIPPNQIHGPSFRFPFGDWFRNPWSKQQQNHYDQSDRSVDYTSTQELQSNPFLPKITMVGISTGEVGQLSKAKLKKTMEELTKGLELPDQGHATFSESKCVDRDPLFVSNVGDYYSGVGKRASPRFVRGGIN